jgi:hypothetical protein
MELADLLVLGLERLQHKADQGDRLHKRGVPEDFGVSQAHQTSTQDKD